MAKEEKNVKDASVGEIGNGNLLGVVDGVLKQIETDKTGGLMTFDKGVSKDDINVEGGVTGFEPIGEVKEGDSRAVSGEEVYNTITTGVCISTSGILSIDYVTRKITIPSSYYYNNGRIGIDSVTLDMYSDSFSNIILDLSNNKIQNIKTLEIESLKYKYLLLAVISDKNGGNIWSTFNNIKVNGQPYNYYANTSKAVLAFSDEKRITTTSTDIVIPSSIIIACNNERFNFSANISLQVKGVFGYVFFNRTSKNFRVEQGDYSSLVKNDDLLILCYSVVNNLITVFGTDIVANKYDNNIENDFNISAITDSIVINSIDREVIFPKNFNVYIKGKQYLFRNEEETKVNLINPAGYNCRYLYLNLTKVINNKELDFVSRPQNDTYQFTNNEYKLIAVIPDDFWKNGLNAWALFDFINENTKSRNNVCVEGWETHVPKVKSLNPNDSDILLDATKKGEFNKFIQLWDDLIPLTDKVKTYISKCWIDGTPYDNTNKCMSSTPTLGSHNPDSNLETYPLLRYKFTPNTDDGVSYSDEYKPIRKKMLWVSGIHGGSSGGDHWESPVATYYIAKKLALEFFESETFSRVRNDYEIHFIPALNPWGLDNLQRYNGEGIDINRDFKTDGGFLTNEAKAIRDILATEKFDFFYDSHCLGGTSLTNGDLLGSNFMGIATNRMLLQLFRQLTNNIGQRYQLKTNDMALVKDTMPFYAQSTGVLSASSEIPANTPLFIGDLNGKPHGEEVVRRCVIYLQNVFSAMCNFINK